MNVRPLRDIVNAFLKLGLTAFGGPIAHIGYFREEFVLRRKWCDEETYMNIVALCNFLPGPASSQVGMLLGMIRGGLLGAFLAWVSFTIPSAIILMLFANYYREHAATINYNWIHGLKLVAVAIVAQAVIGMAGNRIKDYRHILIITYGLFVCSISQSLTSQSLALLGGAIYGSVFLMDMTTDKTIKLPIYISKKLANSSAIAFVSLIIVSAFIIKFSSNSLVKILADMIVIGASVFGGGHVVLPMLQQAVVENGIITNDAFLAGYGLAQAIPGPLFTFSAYLGAIIAQSPFSFIYGSLCLIAIFIPSFLLIIIVVPLWNAVQHNQRIQAGVKGIECAVIGILGAALYNPVYLTAVKSGYDKVLVALMIILLIVAKLPSYLIVLFSLACSGLIGFYK